MAKKRSKQIATGRKSDEFLQNIKSWLGVQLPSSSSSSSVLPVSSPKPTQIRLLKSLSNMPRNVSPSCKHYESFQFSDQELGRGSYGSVSAACAAEECDMDEYNYAAKIVELRNARQQKEFLVEATLTHFAGRQGFGVPVATFFLCDHGRKGILVMNRMEPVVSIELKQIPGLLKKFDMMHQNGILHGDLFPRNVLADPRTKEIFIADFGLSFVLNGPVPFDLRASDVVGFILGQPPELQAGLKPKYLAQSVYAEYRAKFQNDAALLRGIQMRLNRLAKSASRPGEGGAPYAINCVAYYRAIYSAVAPTYVKQLGIDGILKKSVWANFCPDEEDSETVDNLAHQLLGP